MPPATYSSCQTLLDGYFNVIFYSKDFFLLENNFSKMIFGGQALAVPQNPYAGNKRLRREPPVDTPALEYHLVQVFLN